VLEDTEIGIDGAHHPPRLPEIEMRHLMLYAAQGMIADVCAIGFLLLSLIIRES
jgi:hypothetical protein